MSLSVPSPIVDPKRPAASTLMGNQIGQSARKQVVNFRCDPELLAEMRNAAAREHRTLSSFIIAACADRVSGSGSQG